MKRNSRNLKDYRELSVGARQSWKNFELASELPVELHMLSRHGRSLTVTAGGYKTKFIMSVSV